MIKVVVADDELKVCQLICGLIDWASLDMEIVGVAHNGIETLELIQTLQPDLVITDIRMPGYDGLEMISRAIKIKKDIYFIIVSGYRHFEYAQVALKYGVSDYILKPIKKNELMDTLNKVREKYKQKTEQLSNEERLKIRLQSDIEKLRSGLFTDILFHKSVYFEPIQIEQINKDYHYDFQPGCFQVCVIKVDCEYEGVFENSIKILEDKVIQILRGQLKSICFDLEIFFRDSWAYCMLNYSESNKKTVRRQLKVCLDELLLQKNIFDKIEFTIGLGAAISSINQLPVSLKAAERAAAQRILEGTGKLIEDLPPQDIALDEDALLINFSKNMEPALEVLNADIMIQEIGLLKVFVLQKENVSGQTIFDVVIKACRLYLLSLKKYQFNIGNADEFLDNFYAHADLCSSAAQLFAYLSKVIGESVSYIIEDRKQADTKPIRTAKQYIQKNYMQPISLEEVGNIVGFNSSYFSSLFKKESGKNFLEYLSEVRMNKAKELLRETSLSIAAICEQVGYNDLKHFTKSFKKFTGIKPNEFRKLYS
ncbi:helix-turn-helix domain-containing protein [Hydrogenoanaerobacterium sp.]|uniref:helix-turn-helix domain-containing protein n=1 Tax=Hydrogenoanaerobacterium sp. TaxID=2953763 RepID=UPI0028993C66|nr:helix-turn-helix domain-containing protein [Hydrogenoanaerobacterium sp.]